MQIGLGKYPTFILNILIYFIQAMIYSFFNWYDIDMMPQYLVSYRNISLSI